MSPSFALAAKRSVWRRAGSSLALVAALSFGLQPTILLAQSTDPDGTAKAQTKAKSPNANNAAKKATKGKKSPTDNLSDDLNRRESERVEQAMRGMTSPPAVSAPLAAAAATAVSPPVAAASAAPLPPTVAAIPPRSPIVSASLTPDVVGGIGTGAGA